MHTQMLQIMVVLLQQAVEKLTEHVNLMVSSTVLNVVYQGIKFHVKERKKNRNEKFLARF